MAAPRRRQRAARGGAAAIGPLAPLILLLASSFVQPADAWLPPLPTLGTARTRLPPVVICPGTYGRGGSLDPWLTARVKTHTHHPTHTPNQGFGNDAIDYLNPLELGEEESFAAALRRRGFNIYVVVSAC